MAWIEQIEPEDAEGRLKRTYDAALARAGTVFQIVRLQSLRPDILDAWLRYYVAVMLSESGLTRVEREMVATVVSRTNGCHY